MSIASAPHSAQPNDRKPASSGRLSRAIKCAAAVAFVFVTGGPAVMAQFDDNSAATYWRQERQRAQARQGAAPKNRQVVQRPTRLIRGAAPKKGFTRVVPQTAHTQPQAPADPPADPSTAPVQSATTTAPATPGGATPTPTTPPVSTPPASTAPAAPQQAAAPVRVGNATRVAVIGDNVGQLLGRGLEQAFADQRDVTILRLTRDSSGLTNARFFDWSDAVKKMLVSVEKIDIAVMMLGSNDAQELQDGANRYKLRSPEWIKAYKARIESVATQFRDRKIPLIWVGMPIVRGEKLAAEMLAFNEFYRETVQRAGGTYVDIWEAFVDDRSRFTLFGPDINGQIVKQRADDGIHFTPAGSRKLAFFLEAPIKRLIEERRPKTDGLVASASPQTPAASEPPAAAPPPGAAGPEATPTPTETPAAEIRPQAPQMIVAPQRPAAGPVIRLTATEPSPDGQLVTSRRTASATANPQQAFLQRRLIDGAPIEAQPGRADDFSWPRRR